MAVVLSSQTVSDSPQLMVSVQPGTELGDIEDGEYHPGDKRSGERQDSPGTACSISVWLGLDFVLRVQCSGKVGKVTEYMDTR